ncbi:MAG: hypothetical protein H5T69_04170 [Chloroflexi bacterium]|nr:hypothetical protein [Chloroflexota bacterium]
MMDGMAGEYALNIYDLAALGDLAGVLIGPVLGGVAPVGNELVDEVGITLACDEDRALAIIDVLRLRMPRLRAYRRGPRGGWKQLRRAPARTDAR